VTQPSDDYDSPWKEALERYLLPFLEFFFPVAYHDVDWSQGYEFKVDGRNWSNPPIRSQSW